MGVYPPKINSRFRSPGFAGSPAGANAIGAAASFECGSFIRISLCVDLNTKKIGKAGFETNGCGFMIAAADKIIEELSGRELTTLHSFDENEISSLVVAEFGAFPAPRMQCLRVVVQALRNALADHRNFLIEEFRGEKALVCTCFGISEETIETFIAANSPTSIGDVTESCRAGAGCGSCRMMIQEMIDAAANPPFS